VTCNGEGDITSWPLIGKVLISKDQFQQELPFLILVGASEKGTNSLAAIETFHNFPTKSVLFDSELFEHS
jgi:hypothetical protein